MTDADLLTKARARRDAEIRHRAAPPPPRIAPPPGVTWRLARCGLSIRSSSTRAAFGPPFLLRGL